MVADVSVKVFLNHFKGSWHQRVSRTQKPLTPEHDGPLHAAVFTKIIMPEEAKPQLIWSPVTWSQLEADVNKLEHGVMQ